MKKKSIETIGTVVFLSVICGYLFYLFPKKMWIPILLFGAIAYPLAHLLRSALPELMSKKLHKALGIDEQEWEQKYLQSPDRHFFLRKQLKTIHSIARLDVKLLTATFDTGVTFKLQNLPLIEAIKKILAGSRISGCDDDMEHLQIQIHAKNKSFSYNASIQMSNKADIILKFPECGDYGGICLPGLKQLLDEKVL